MLNGFSAVQSVNVTAETGTGLVVSATKPVTGALPWLRLDAFGRPERVYWFASGAWLSLHALVPGLTQWWFNVLPDTPDANNRLPSFDGGDGVAGSAPTVLSGAMWELAKRPNGTVIAAQFPIAAGTLASGTVLAAGDVGGEEKHVLTLAETPPHTHTIQAKNTIGVDNGSRIIAGADADFTNSYNTGSTGGNGATPPVADAHNNVPPFVVGYLLSRTSRLFYAIA